REAIRLGHVLVSLLEDQNVPCQPEAQGLLALMLLHDSRRAARVNGQGELVLLEEQDRRLWDRSEIEAGLALVDRAAAQRQPGPYQVQAAISALHAQAASAGETDWQEIVGLYDALMRLAPSPIVALNRAVALGQAEGPLAGLMALDGLKLDEALEHYHWFHAARADLLRQAGYTLEARASYEQALALCENRAEKVFLQKQLAACRLA